jgi:phosphoribosylformylglycinamidine cyclo-ligase
MDLLLATGKILGGAHVTGGGPEANLRRVLPAHLRPQLSWDWPVPAVFPLLSSAGIAESELRRVFNMGLGIILVVHREDVELVVQEASNAGFELQRAGRLVR